MPTSCLRCARWGTCICCGTSCCFWHQHSPAAKIADHERAAEAGHDGKKTNSSASTGMLNTQRLKDTGLFRVSLGGISARSVSFSRDGKWVSYFSYPDGDLWRCRID